MSSSTKKERTQTFSPPRGAADDSEFPDDFLSPSGATTSGRHPPPPLSSTPSWAQTSSGLASGVGAWGLGRLRAAAQGIGGKELADKWLPAARQEDEDETVNRGTADMAQWAAHTRTSVLDDFAHVTAKARKGVQAALLHPLAAKSGATTHLPPSLAEWAQVETLGSVKPPNQPTEQERQTLEYNPERVQLAQWASVLAAAADQARQEMDPPGGPSLTSSAKSTGGWYLPWTRPASTEPIAFADWLSWIDEEGRLDPRNIEAVPGMPPVSSEANETLAVAQMVRGQVFTRGLDEQTRRTLWPFLLGVYPWHSTESERHEIDLDLSLEFDGWCDRARLALKPPPSEDGPLFDQPADPQVIDQKHRIQMDCDRIDRQHHLFRMETISDPASSCDLVEQGAQEEEEEEERQQPNNVHIRSLVSILLALVLWDNEASTKDPTNAANLDGYAQGLADLCAVLYVSIIPQDCTPKNQAHSKVNALVFGCLRSALVNFGWAAPFRKDQVAMASALAALRGMLRTGAPDVYEHLVRTQADNLFFAYRWLLVTFQRELSLEDTCRVWEAVWAADSESIAATSSPSSIDAFATSQQRGLKPDQSFSLVIAWALIVREKLALAQLQVFDETLQYFNSLAPPLAKRASFGRPASASATANDPTSHRPTANDLLARASRAVHKVPGLWPLPPVHWDQQA